MKTIVKKVSSTDDNSKEYYRQSFGSFDTEEISEREYKRLLKSSVECETHTCNYELYTLTTHLLTHD